MKMTHFAIAGLFLLLGAGIYLTVQTDMDGRMEQQKADFERMRAESDKKIEQLEKTMRDQKAPPAVADAATDLKNTVAGEADAAAAQAKKAIANVKSALEVQSPGAKEIEGAVDNTTKGLTRRANDLTSAPKAAVDGAGENLTETADEVAQRILEKEQDVLNNTGVSDARIARDTAEVTGAIPDNLAPRMTNIQTQIMAQPAIARVENANAAANEGFVILDRGLNANLARGDAFAVRRGTAVIGRVVIGETMEETRCVAEVLARHLVQGMVIQKGDEIIKFDQ